MSNFHDMLSRPLPSKLNSTNSFYESDNYNDSDNTDFDDNEFNTAFSSIDGTEDEKEDIYNSEDNDYDILDDYIGDSCCKEDSSDNSENEETLNGSDDGDSVDENSDSDDDDVDFEKLGKEVDVKEYSYNESDEDYDSEIDNDEDYGFESNTDDEDDKKPLTQDESQRVDDTLNTVGTSVLVKDQLLSDSIDVEEFVESVDCDILEQEGFITERTIIKFDKHAKRAQLFEIAVQAVAREKNDPLYKKLETVYKMERIIKSKLRKRYHTQANNKVKEYLNRAKKSKSGILSKIANKITSKK